MIKLIAAAVVAGASFGASAAGTNLILDGNFSSVTVTPGNWTTVSSTSVGGVTAWTSTNGIELRNDIAGTAPAGDSNFAELDTWENSSISQSFTTVVGQTYQLSFLTEDRPGVTDPALTDGLTYLVTNGTSSNAATLVQGAVAGGKDATWTEVSENFIATSTTSVLTIAAAGLSDSYGSSLDNISVTTTVPEPASIVMLASGLALLGLSRRRNRK